MPREIIRVSIDQLPHISSSRSPSSSDTCRGLTHHSTSITTLPIASGSSSSQTQSMEALSSGSSSSQTRPPRSPQRPSFSRRQRFSPKSKSSDPCFTQLASHIAKVQAQPHKPKRPSPLHVSVSPSSLEAEIDELSDSSCSEGESICEASDSRDKVGLSPIVEERGNMLGLDLDGEWSWTCELQERLKEPKTPFPSPAILV